MEQGLNKYIDCPRSSTKSLAAAMSACFFRECGGELKSALREKSSIEAVKEDLNIVDSSLRLYE
jgi:hypothetical protein